MEYSIDLLIIERNKLLDELILAKNGEEKNWDWGIIIKNERLLEDLNKAIDLLFMVK